MKLSTWMHYHARGTRLSAQQNARCGNIMHSMPCARHNIVGRMPGMRRPAPLRVGRSGRHAEAQTRRVTRHCQCGSSWGDAQVSQN
ncbi:hypothetical protein HAX54_035480, partial [Datura stramonium]|nr:hypothetical protein [Datura stramonium]